MQLANSCKTGHLSWNSQLPSNRCNSVSWSLVFHQRKGPDHSQLLH